MLFHCSWHGLLRAYLPSPQLLLCGAVIAEMEHGSPSDLELEFVERRGLHLLHEIKRADAHRDVRVKVLAAALSNKSVDVFERGFVDARIDLPP